ncbi:MAG: large conductance mechanosensitive channel protein MscL [Promicromonosporaceae bacterium]|nr:large conductance mechanosensitive channel protein MscL [Promicromonosporaceae bacterium]
MLKGFKDFLLRGNVLDLAVGIIIGAAFTAAVTGLMDGLLNPLIALIFGRPDVSSVAFAIGSTSFPVGLFLQAILNFVIVAVVLYFAVVAPVGRLVARRPAAPPAEPAADVALLVEIRDLLAKAHNH